VMEDSLGKGILCLIQFIVEYAQSHLDLSCILDRVVLRPRV